MKQYIVDSFTDQVFHGNQAAVCVMNSWPDEQLMRDIARENSFSETAFTVRENDAWRLRWLLNRESKKKGEEVIRKRFLLAMLGTIIV